MNALTLTYDGTTKSLEAWGFNRDPIMVYRHLQAGTFTVTAQGADPASSPAIPYGGLAVIKDGDTTIFVGYRNEYAASAKGNARGITYVFSDVWDSLTRTTYKQQWNLNGTTTYSSRVFLFQNITVGDAAVPWGYWTTAQQITDIINYAQTKCGLAIQAGTIDPLMMQPVTPYRGIMCSQAIEECLTSLPDVITWFDYSTTIDGAPVPTLHIRHRQNAAPVTLPYANGEQGAEGQTHISSEIKSREDLQVPEVVFDYQETDVADSITYVAFGTDVYPPGADGFAENACNMSVDLRGSSRHIATGTIQSADFDETSADFWKAKKPDLGKADISGLTISNGAVTGPDGGDVDSDTYPYEYIEGVAAPWMLDDTGVPIAIIEAQVVCDAAYARAEANGTVTASVTTHHMATRIKLTNSPPSHNDTPYQALASSSQAELPPDNLAYQFWCACNNIAVNLVDGVPTPPGSTPSLTDPSCLEWEGQHLIGEINISTYYNCGNVLNLDDSDGGNASWAEMNASIFSVEYDFFRGYTTINFGPHKRETRQQFFYRMMLFRTRIAWENPNVRSTSQDSAGAGTQIGDRTRVQDTTESTVPSLGYHTVVTVPSEGTQYIHRDDSGVHTDADGQPQIYQALINSDGTENTAANRVSLRMADLSDEEDDRISIEYRLIVYKNASCVTKHRWIPCSQEFDGDGS